MIEHVDEDDAERPNVGRGGSISWRNIVMAFITHIWCTSTVHVSTLDIPRGKTKIGQLDSHLAFSLACERIDRV